MTYYNETEARQLVVEAGHKLVENKLIARTWGNISARISENEFIITPSGRAYDTLNPWNLIKVRADDLSYEGDVKPSSEKGIHAGAYLLRPKCGFIIHTHQFFASAVCAEGENLPFAPCAKYGLPGTGKLKSGVCDCISLNHNFKSFLMEKHGALFLGENYEEAFSLADDLEKRCLEQFVSRVGEEKEEELIALYARSHNTLPAYIDDYAQLVGASARISGTTLELPETDDEEAMRMIVRKNCAAALYCRKAKPIPAPEALLQRLVYLKKYSKLKDR